MYKKSDYLQVPTVGGNFRKSVPSANLLLYNEVYAKNVKWISREKKPLKIEELDSNFKRELTDSSLNYLKIRDTAAEIEGLFPETWQRLPDSVLEEINRPELTELAHHTSGAVLRFQTDTPVLGLCMELLEPDFMMSHMPLTGSAGMDVFADGRYVATFRAEPGEKTVKGEVPLSGEKTDITVYLPLYNGVKEFYLGISRHACILKPSEHKIKEPVIFYGSSITQGGCASRTSNAYPALVTRWLDAGMYCLGFSGNAKGDLPIARYIAGLPASCLVYDYDYNAPDAAFLGETHRPFLEYILSCNPKLPVLVMSRPNPEFKSEELQSRTRRQIVQETVLKCREKGYQVNFLDGVELFGEESRECCTVDGIHPNDLGFYRIAKKVLKEIQELLK